MRKLRQQAVNFMLRRVGFSWMDKKKSMARVIISSKNVNILEKLVKTAIEMKAEKLFFSMTESSGEIVKFLDIKKAAGSIIARAGNNLRVVFNNFPLCILEDGKQYIFWSNKDRYIKPNNCGFCKYGKICGGISQIYREKFGGDELIIVKDLPTEVMIEIEPRCNFDCEFCFNKLTFARNGREEVGLLPADYIKAIIKRIREAGIEVIRFTGGEPLLRPDIFEILEYAKSLNFSQIRFNTNGFFINKENARQLVKFVDNFLLPLESPYAEDEEKICGTKNALERKIEAVNLLVESGANIVRVGTVATQAAINNLEKIEKLVNSTSATHWTLFRPIPFEKNSNPSNPEQIETLVMSLYRMARKNPKKIYRIGNSIPFCAIKKPEILEAMSDGALFEDGHNRYVVDPRGFSKPHYFIDENIGDPLDPMACWNHPFMKKMRNLEFLPGECKKCLFLFKCRGGNRFIAKAQAGSYAGRDPLANYKNAELKLLN